MIEADPWARDRLRERPSEVRPRRTQDGSLPATAGIPVAPGDLVRFPDGRRRRVTTTFVCQDPWSGIRWWWSFFQDGTVLDQTSTGDWHYVTHEVLPLDARFARELVGPNGYLEDFETRVRRGESAPIVEVPFADRKWHVARTGVAVATRVGQNAPLAGWSSLGNADADTSNVWFILEDRSRPLYATIGIWTNHVALATGRRLTPRRRRTSRAPEVPDYP
jgi:hypothetical protein